MHEKLFWRGILFLWVFVPLRGHFSLPITRTGFTAFFPRISGKRSECCRPSAVADRSTFPPQIPQANPHTAGRPFFSDQRRAQPGKNAFPWRRFAGVKTLATKNTKTHEKLFWRFPYWWQRPLVAAAPAIPAPWRSWRAWRGTISRKGRKAREGKSWAQPFLWLFVAIPSCPSPPEGVE